MGLRWQAGYWRSKPFPTSSGSREAYRMLYTILCRTLSWFWAFHVMRCPTWSKWWPKLAGRLDDSRPRYTALGEKLIILLYFNDNENLC